MRARSTQPTPHPFSELGARCRIRGASPSSLFSPIYCDPLGCTRLWPCGQWPDQVRRSNSSTTSPAAFDRKRAFRGPGAGLGRNFLLAVAFGIQFSEGSAPLSAPRLFWPESHPGIFLEGPILKFSQLDIQGNAESLRHRQPRLSNRLLRMGTLFEISLCSSEFRELGKPRQRSHPHNPTAHRVTTPQREQPC
jgi:hypothetical protein